MTRLAPLWRDTHSGRMRHRPRAGAAWREGLPAAAPGRWQSELRDTWRQLLRVLRIALLCYLVAMALAPAPKRIPVTLQPTWVDR